MDYKSSIGRKSIHIVETPGLGDSRNGAAAPWAARRAAGTAASALSITLLLGVGCSSTGSTEGQTGITSTVWDAPNGWCHDTYAPEGNRWYQIHRDRCISDFVPYSMPRCIREVASGLETRRLMPGVTLGRNGERIFGNSWADAIGEPNSHGMTVRDGRVVPLWEKAVGQLAAYGVPNTASMWRIRRVDLRSALARTPDPGVAAALEGSPDEWIYFTENEIAVSGQIFPLPDGISAKHSAVEPGEIVMALEGPMPDRPVISMSGESGSAVGYWGPGDGSGGVVVVWRTSDAERLQSVAPSGGNLTSEGNWVVGTANGEILVLHRLTGAILDHLRFSEGINARYGLVGEAALTRDSLLNLNSIAVGRNPETGLDHLYLALTHGRLSKLATAGGVNFELGEAQAGYMAAATWDPAARQLRFLWAEKLDQELSEASPTIHPVNGIVFTAFGDYSGVADAVDADAPTDLMAFGPNGGLLARLPLTGRTVASPAIVPADPKRGILHDYVVIGAGSGKLNTPQVFRFDAETHTLTHVYRGSISRDAVLLSNLYVNEDGLMFSGAAFLDSLRSGKLFFGVFDILAILQEQPAARVTLVDRARVRSISCNNAVYDGAHERYLYSMSCSPDLADPADAEPPYEPEGSYGIQVFGRDEADDPADGCEME